MNNLSILVSLIKKLKYKDHGKVVLEFLGDDQVEGDDTSIPFIENQTEKYQKTWQEAIDFICSIYEHRLIFRVITDEPMKFSDYREKQIELLKTEITNYYDWN